MSTKETVLELINRGWVKFAEIVENGIVREMRFSDGQEVLAVLVDSDDNCEVIG